MKKLTTKTIVIIGLVLGAAMLVWAFLEGPYRDTAGYQPFPAELTLQGDSYLTPENEELTREKITNYQTRLESPELDGDVSTKTGLYVALAANYQLLGEYENMLAAINEAVILNPREQGVVRTYSEMLYRVGDYKGALEQADRAVAIAPANSQPWLWRLELERNLLVNQLDAAPLYEQALEATQYDQEIMVNFAEFYEWNGEKEASISVWEDLAERFPDQAEVYRAKAEELASPAL